MFPFLLFQGFFVALQHPLFRRSGLNTTRALPVFITMGLLYNSNERWSPVIYITWVCEFRNRHLVSTVAKQNSISSGRARRDSPCHPAPHTQLPLGQHREIGFNIDYFLSRWGVWIIDPSDVLGFTLSENITVVISHEACVYIACLSILTWKSSSKTNSNKSWHSFRFLSFPCIYSYLIRLIRANNPHFVVINFL